MLQIEEMQRKGPGPGPKLSRLPPGTGIHIVQKGEGSRFTNVKDID